MNMNSREGEGAPGKTLVPPGLQLPGPRRNAAPDGEAGRAGTLRASKETREGGKELGKCPRIGTECPDTI